jgi:hypothetical protein
MNDLFLSLLILVGIPLLVVSAVGLKFFILFLIQGAKGRDIKTGWQRLLQAYATAKLPTGHIVPKQTVLIGLGWYKRCVTLGIADDGLYLSIRRDTVSIPWADFRLADPNAFHRHGVFLLTVGDPTITTINVPWDVFQMLQGRLPVANAEA